MIDVPNFIEVTNVTEDKRGNKSFNKIYMRHSLISSILAGKDGYTYLYYATGDGDALVAKVEETYEEVKAKLIAALS